jgi:hypothetical protein
MSCEVPPGGIRENPAYDISGTPTHLLLPK